MLRRRFHQHFALFFFFTASVTTSIPLTFPNCNHTFSCGSLQNLSYPFTGGSRPAYCGPPQFNLNCDVNNQTTLLTYNVIQLDPSRKALTLASSELFTDDVSNNNNNCSSLGDLFHETNGSLDSSVFTLSENDNVFLTFFYNCNSSAIDPRMKSYLNSFTCKTNSSGTEAYYVVGEGFSDPALTAIGCTASESAPVVKTAPYNDTSVGIMEVLRYGFSVDYSNPYDDECATCENIGGLCGFDDEFGGPICICDNDIVCDVSESEAAERRKLGLTIGLPLFAGAFLGSLCLGIYLRRKKKKDESNEQLNTHTDHSATTPTTNLSGSIPSYPSSNLDLEKGGNYFGAQIFNFADLEEATDNFNAERELGDGGFGTVYYGELKDGRVVAVKRLYDNNFKRAEQFMNEIQILSCLRHPNLVTLYGCTSRQSRELVLVYEYVPNGTVADHIHQDEENPGLLITWPIRLRIAVETATALSYLHTRDVIHRDVKTNNILLDKNFHVKVADFGMSRLLPDNVSHVSTAPQGTPGYVDPEYYQCYQLTDKSDVYSFGVVLSELITSKEAVDTSRSRHDINLANMAVNRIQNHALHEIVGPRLGFEDNFAVRSSMTSVAELAFRCLQHDRDLRPSMAEILKTLKELEDELLEASKAEVVDIGADDVGLLKNFPPPLSPTSPDPGANENKWVSRHESF